MGRSKSLFFVLLLVVLVVVSQFIFLHAVPTTRGAGSLFGYRENRIPVLKENHHVVMREETLEEMIMNGRMDLEKNDYSESGPNVKHTPQPPS